MFIFLGLVLIAAAIGYLGKAIRMLDFNRLNNALSALGTAVTSVADAIRNPHVDNNSQTAIDTMAGKLEEVAGTLTGLADEENAEDNAEAATDVEPVDAGELPAQPVDTDTGSNDGTPVENQGEGTIDGEGEEPPLVA